MATNDCLPQYVLCNPGHRNVYPREEPDRHRERRTQERGRIVDEQNELERRGLQSRLLTIGEVARLVAQEVHINNVVYVLAWICPGLEDKVFGSGLMAPESMTTRPGHQVISSQCLEANEWKILSDYNLPCASGYVQDIVFLGKCVFHPILDYTQCTLFHLEVFIL